MAQRGKASIEVRPITFEWDGETFTVHNDTDRWTIGEMRAVERAFGAHIEDMGLLDKTSAVIAVSIKRARPDFKLHEVENLPMELVGEVLRKREEQAEAAEAANPPASEADGDQAADG